MTPREFQSAREALGWSKPQLAKRLGYGSHVSIIRIERGESDPKPEHAAWLREVSAPIIAKPNP
jgi:transcriptional regulator with XRE-family HTH domain